MHVIASAPAWRVGAADRIRSSRMRIDRTTRLTRNPFAEDSHAEAMQHPLEEPSSERRVTGSNTGLVKGQHALDRLYVATRQAFIQRTTRPNSCCLVATSSTARSTRGSFPPPTGSGVGQHAAREVRTNIRRVPFDLAPELWTPYRSSCGASAEITPGPRESGLFSGFYPRTFGTPISFSSDLNSDRCSAVRGRAGRRPGPPLRPISS